MSDHIQQTIRALEQDLEVKQGECADIERALIPLRRMAGLKEDGEPAAPRPRRKYKRRAGASKAATTTRVPHLSDEAGPRENGRREKILALLADDALPTRELATQLRLDKKLTKMTLQRMAKVGLIKGVGHGPGRKWARAKTQQAPKPNGSMKRPTDTPSTVDVVEELDGTVLSNLKAAGRVGRTVREIQISNSDQSEAAILRSLTRLKVKQKAHVDDSGRWTAI